MLNGRPRLLLTMCGLLALPNAGLAQALDFAGLADVLASKLDPQPGEGVLLVIAPGRFDNLVTLLEQRIDAAGAEYLGTWSVTGSGPAHWRTAQMRDFDDNTSDGALAELLSRIDASIMLPGANPGHRIYAAIQNELRAGRGRTIHFHWEGAYDFDGNLLAVNPDIDALYQAAVIHTDYAALASAQQQFEDAMRGAEVRVTTPAGTDIRFEIGDRPVNRQDGDASFAGASGPILIDREIELPAGAIRVAPIESTVAGRIVFPRSWWKDTLVENLSMTFAGGVAADITADTGIDEVMQEINEAGLAGRSFREFALGFNPCIPVQQGSQPYTPYYGYGSGVVRLSLGDNSELGGNVGGGYVRWNFFTDATVTVDGQPWAQSDDCPASTSPEKPDPPKLIGQN